VPRDELWDRISEELAVGAERDEATPMWPATGPTAIGGERRSMPAERAADEVAEAGSGTGESRPGRSPARDQWSAWERSAPGAPGAPPARDEDAPHDRADAGARAGTPASARRDEAPDHPDPAEARQEADVEEEETAEEESAAPSPWSIPLTLVEDLSGFGEEDDRQPAGPDSVVGDGGTEAAAAADSRRAPETTGFDVWSRAPRPGGVEKTRTGPPETDGGSGREEPEEAAQASVGAGMAGVSQGGEGAVGDGDFGRSPAGGDTDTDGAARAPRDGGDADAAATRAPRDGGDADADAPAQHPGADEDAGADRDATASKASGDLAADRDGGEAGAGSDAGAPRAGGDAGDGAAAHTGAASRTGVDTADAGANDGEADAGDDAGTGSRAAPGSATAAAGPAVGTASEAREPPSAGDTQASEAAQASDGAQASKGAGEPPAGSQNDHEPPGRSQTPEGNVVVIVPGVARYHRSACILIRFLGADDLETSTAQEAEANGCAPCRACEPQKPLSDGT
jgi:hypothetical protein